MNSQLLIVIGFGLVLLIGLGVGAYFLFGRRKSAVAERLGEFTGSGQVVVSSKPEEERGSSVNALSEALSRTLQGQGFADAISKQLSQADVKLNVVEYGVMHLFTVAIGFGVGYALLGGLLWGVLAGVAGFFAPGMWVNSQQKGRLKKFDNQLGDMLNLVVNGLRAGYSVMQALEAVSKELPPPISTEFRRVVQEMQLGLAPEQALANLLRRIPSKDLDFVVTAMNVQREVGGNLAEILDSISFTIRERVRIKGEIETLTAQGMMTGYVISLLPIGLGLFLTLINPKYMGQLWERGRFFICGIGMIGAVLMMIGIGFAIIMKIVNIEV